MTTTTESTAAQPPPPTSARPPRSGVSVRTRIAATVALLVTVALAGAGLIVFVVEGERIEQQAVDEAEQELDEFANLVNQGIDPETGSRFPSVDGLLNLYLSRNVPDDDEALVGWIGSAPALQFPDDGLTDDPTFLAAAAPLVRAGGSARIDTRQGTTLVTAKPVVLETETGALVVVKYLDADRAELLDTMRTFTIVALLSLLAVVAVATWVSGRLLAPLRVLRETADEITETDLARRIPETGNDDITALTRTVNGMLDRIESAFVGQRRFLDDAGHELRTPLTVLRGHLELLDPESREDVEETRALLLDEIDRMARLVGELTLLAKSDRPDFVTPGPVDLEALTHDVLAKARGLGERTWSLDGSGQATVTLDEQRITQALLQLCDNAVKHTREGQLIALGSSYDDDWVELWVRDTGPGVRAADRDIIFARFGRGTVPEDDEGFGLGLSIVEAIAAAHGGTVHLEDGRPTGACFVITLPAADALADPDALPQTHADETTPTTTREDPAWPAS
ncbi:MAG: HAMP domain-containing protein [Nocardioides sp.]|nr:HAMP domain-containing protein [Nocardioides sp.]